MLPDNNRCNQQNSEREQNSTGQKNLTTYYKEQKGKNVQMTRNLRDILVKCTVGTLTGS